MAWYNEQDPEEKNTTDYSGVIIFAMMLPVYFLVKYFENPDIALSACICLGMNLLAIRIRWELRKCFWFWVIIVLALALQVPLVLMIPWPNITINRITLLPIGVAVLGITLGAVKFVETFVVRYVPPEEEE